jgi:predicted nucleotidyltransferase
LKKKLSLLMPVLEEEYHVQAIEIFGSYARGEESHKSDLDLLITFSQPFSLWDLLDVKEFLSQKLLMGFWLGVGGRILSCRLCGFL